MWQPMDGRAPAAPRPIAAGSGRALPAGCRTTGVLRRFVRFGLVGAVGMVVNTILFAAACEIGLPVLAAAFLSMQAATAVNFVASEKAVFADRRRGRRRVRAASFFAVATAGFLVTGPLMIVLIGASVPPALANVAAIGTLTVVRFAIADRIIWSAGKAGRESAPAAAIDHSTGLPDGEESLTPPASGW